MKGSQVILTTVVFLRTLFVWGQAINPIPLYPNGVPGAKVPSATYTEKDLGGRVAKVTNPTLVPFFPEKNTANGTAVIICPGGGYGFLAMGPEGYPAAKAFTKIGITAFVLKYRLPSDSIMIDKAIGPLQDAQSAIALVRSRATEWGINPSRIGIVGFSAGGHVASTAGTHYNTSVIDTKSEGNLRPDFMILVYPVITFGEFTHAGTKKGLIGINPTPEQIDLYSNEKQITSTTPLTFIVHAEDDQVVPVQNSLLFYEALRKNNIPAEMHIYPTGGHGFGLTNRKSKGQWFDWCTSWLDTNGFLSSN